MVIEAEKSIGILATLFAFMGGAIVFTIADMIAEKKGGGAGILLGIGLDSIPESLAIGAAIASGPYLALSFLIGIQNVSEGISSYREMMTGKPPLAITQRKYLPLLL
jgi:ZIP family zinc transporter